MSLFGQKSGPGLSINTTAANTSNTQPAPSNSGLFGSTQSSQPPAGGGLFGSATQTSQPQTSGGLFGNSTQTSQPAPSGGLFSNPSGGTSQPQQGGGLFGSSTQTSQPQQGGGLFGSNTQTSQPQQGGGLFGNSNQTSQPQQSGGLFGSGTQTSQAQQGGGLFGNTGQNTTSSQSQPGGGLFSNLGKTQPQQSSGLFSGLGQSTTNQSQQNTTAQPQQTGFGLLNSNVAGNTLGASTSDPSQSTNQSSGVKINVEHLRTTTRYEQLTDDLQKEIMALDAFILDQINMSHEVSDLIPIVAGIGENLPNDVRFVSDKLEELQLGLENDAIDINNLRDKVVAKDASEARLCFRGVERLNMPAQYQQQQLYQSVNGADSSGLQGWWNHPQTLQKSLRGATGAGGRRNLQLPGEDEEESNGPSNLVDFFETRIVEMNDTLKGYKDIMHEIEGHLDGVEMTIAMKQRELNDSRSSGGIMGRGADEQARNLKYALGVFERSIFDVADHVGSARDGVRELILGKSGTDPRSGFSRLAW